MGSFNDTCLISGLPIKYGQEVVTLLIQPKPGGLSRGWSCYSNDYADVAPLPFYGKYNDYGSVEECHGPAMDLLVEEVRENLIEKELGKNPSHDVAVSRKDLDMEKMLEAMWEGRLEVVRAGSNLQYVFVLQSVMDKILTEYQVRDYYFEDVPGSKPKKSIYHRYSYGFKSIVRDIPEYVRRLRAKLAKQDENLAAGLKVRSYFLFEEMSDLFAWKETNLAGKYLRFGRSEGESTVIFRPVQFLTEHAPNMTDDQLIELLTEFAKVQWLRRFMNDANKMWFKPMTSGQDGLTTAHELIAKTTYEYIAEAKAEYDDEEDDDEEDDDDGNSPLANLDEDEEYAKRLRDISAATADDNDAL